MKRAAAAAAILACACSPTVDRESAGVERAAITGGSIDDADPAVVALADARGVGCSGTLIAPHVVLTAGHCAEGVTPHGPVKVVFGSDAASGTSIEIADVHVHPGFDPGNFANDVALFALAADPPASAAPIPPLAVTPDASLVNATVTLVGFGETAADAGDLGKKRKGTAKIASVTATTIALTGTSHTCTGDSGGPALLDVSGTTYVAGITSRGDATCTGNDTDTRVDGFADFIASYVAATGEGTAKVGDRCFYARQCAAGNCIAASDDPTITYCAPTCDGSAGCPSTMTCSDGQCRYPTPTPGAIGSTCTTQSDCASTDCNAKHVCSKRCVSSDECPSGFDCENVGSIDFYCMPQPKSDGGSSGCGLAGGRDGGGGELATSMIVIAGAAILRARRRRP